MRVLTRPTICAHLLGILFFLTSYLGVAQSASLFGTVTNSTGEPVAGIIVQISTICMNLPCIGTSPIETVTQSDGTYIFSFPGSGGMPDLMVHAPINWTETPYVLRSWRLLDTQENQQLDFELELASTIIGIIRTVDGEPLSTNELSGIGVHAILQVTSEPVCLPNVIQTLPINGGYAMTTYNGTIQPDGSYTIPGLPSGVSFQVVAMGDDTVNYIPEWSTGTTSVNQCDHTSTLTITTPDSQMERINFQLDPGATVKGTVFHNHQVTTEDLRILKVINTNPCSLTFNPFVSIDIQDDGSYTFTGLPVGNYNFLAYPIANHPMVEPEWLTGVKSNSSSDCQLAETITVTAEKPKQIFTQRNFQLGVGGNISGTVYKQPDKVADETSYIVRFQNSCTDAQTMEEATTESGSYYSPVLAPNVYYLSLLERDGSSVIGWRTTSGAVVQDCAATSPINVEDNQTNNGIDFLFKKHPSLVPVYQLILKKQCTSSTPVTIKVTNNFPGSEIVHCIVFPPRTGLDPIVERLHLQVPPGTTIDFITYLNEKILVLLFDDNPKSPSGLESFTVSECTLYKKTYPDDE